MKMLELIRQFHDNDKRESMEIPMELMDVAAYAVIEKKYKRFLETQIRFFPYILKSQWRIMYGKSRGAGHNVLKELVDLKVLGEANYRGCHYVYPITRAMKWYLKDKAAKPMNSKVNRSSDLPLLDSFMRAEYFLHRGNPLAISPLPFFNRQLKQLNVLPRLYTRPFQKLYEKWHKKRVFKNQNINLDFDDKKEVINVNQNPECYRFIALCLSSLTDRRCYFERVNITETGLIVKLAVTHFGDSDPNRFIDIIKSMNEICNCFEKVKFSMVILCKSEGHTNNMGEELKNSLIKRKKELKRLRQPSDHIDINSISVYNTDLDRYFTEGDADELFKDNLEDLEKLLSEFKLLAEHLD